MRSRSIKTCSVLWVLVFFVSLCLVSQATDAGVLGDFVIEVNGVTHIDFDTGDFVSTGMDFEQLPPEFGFDLHVCSGVADLSQDPVTTSGDIVWSGPEGTLIAEWVDGLVFFNPDGSGIGIADFTIVSGDGIFSEVSSGYGAFVSVNAPFDEYGDADTTHLFVGTLFPGPGTAAALALSVFALSHRRRRHASIV